MQLLTYHYAICAPHQAFKSTLLEHGMSELVSARCWAKSEAPDGAVSMRNMALCNVFASNRKLQGRSTAKFLQGALTFEGTAPNLGETGEGVTESLLLDTARVAANYAAASTWILPARKTCPSGNVLSKIRNSLLKGPPLYACLGCSCLRSGGAAESCSS